MTRITALSPQFLVFVAGGALSALVDIGVLQLLVASGVGAFQATTTGFLAGLAVNYAFHARVTFKNVTTLGTLARFLCVVGINYLITLGFVAASLALFQIPLLGKLVSLPVVALNGFFLSKYWIFK
jgi:putative flippase GtrA